MSKRTAKIAAGVLVFLFVLSISTAFAQTTAATDDSGYQTAKEVWQKRQEEIKTRRETATQELRQKDLKIAQTMATKAVERAIAKLQRIVQRIEKMAVLTDARKAKLVAELKAEIATLQDLKTKIAATTTKEELKTLVGDARKEIIETRATIEKIVAEILASHIDGLIERLTTIASKLETEIAGLKAKSQDVSALETSLKEAKDLISQAKTKNKAGERKEARKLGEQARTKLAKLAGQIKAAKAKSGGENANQ